MYRIFAQSYTVLCVYTDLVVPIKRPDVQLKILVKLPNFYDWLAHTKTSYHLTSESVCVERQGGGAQPTVCAEEGEGQW